MNNYVEPTDISKSEFLEIIESEGIEQKCDAIVRAVHFIPDYDWLIRVFSKLLSDNSIEVKGAVVTCIGHLARLNDQSTKEELLNILTPLLSDHEIVGRVEDAIDDVRTFL